MLSKTMEKALNKQVNAEMYSAYLYQSMATWATAKGLKGLANWMSVQAKEEMVHALKFYGFIEARGGRVLLTAIEGPPTDWESPVAVAEAVAAHESKVTGLINALADLALKEKDHATHSFLKWFIDEQVEEEESARKLIDDLKLGSESAGGMLLVDRELATRVFTPPPTGGAA